MCICFVFHFTTAQKNNLHLSSSVHEEARFISAKSGDRVTLHCYYEHNVAAIFYWYKQTLGEKPKLISTFYKSETNFVKFHGPFNNTTRFRLDNGNGKKHLIISDLSVSDSATYYCIRSYFYTSTFLETIIVSVNDSDLNVQALVHQSASETIQPGGSVSLHCMVHTMLSCDGEHSVYWFKDSEDSQPGLIYTHGVRNGHCERKDNKSTHTCVYNLRMESLNVSHTGIYYCAVASCGHILFGNGTKLDFGGFTIRRDSAALMYFLSAALTLTTIISVSSTFLVYKMKKRNNCQSRDSNANDSVNLESTQEDNLHYAALRKIRTKEARRQRSNTEDTCVYSSIK
ncbi:immunoglobulin kappa light chain-like isoform X1 [Astatotilapia calliptera]|uniref:immunoglobulin kappa light chain-like isoform X1 n=1 Tax=Astatotilapia calliptera TaxID=8154 RepID=UPI000E3FB984|nr:immunoglobulin kappa light chain-like isoform X1 [Astatotilapia calliptera]